MKVADPEVASVPPCAVTRNWEVLTPSLEVRYCFEKKEKRCERECVDPQKKRTHLEESVQITAEAGNNRIAGWKEGKHIVGSIRPRV